MLFRLSCFPRRSSPSLWAFGLMLVASAAQASVSVESIRKALENGQLDAAVRLVQQEKSQKPNDPQIRFFEGVVLAQQGQTDKAIETFRKLIEMHPGMLEAHNNLGVLYASKGKLEAARKALEAGLLVSSSVATLHRNLGDVQSQLARQTYARALQVDGKTRMAPPQLALLGSLEPGLLSSATAAAAQPKAPADPVKPVVAATAASSAPAQEVQTAAASPVQQAAGPSALPARQPALTGSSAVAAASAAVHASPPADSPVPAKAQASLETRPKSADSERDTAREQEKDKIRQAVTAWARAWSRKDMPAYFSAYAGNFTPNDKMSRARWEEERKLRILSKRKISVEIKSPKVTLTDASRATVQFQQIYESDNFKGNSRKHLEMIKLQGQWLIWRETVN